MACSVNTAVAPNPAETALNKGDYKPAEDLFRALLAMSADNEAAHEGLIRAMLAQDKVADAAKDAESWVAAAPASSMAMTALGDVRLRQGNPREGFAKYRVRYKRTSATPVRTMEKPESMILPVILPPESRRLNLPTNCILPTMTSMVPGY